MVSSVVPDALSNPTTVLQSLYQRNRNHHELARVVHDHFSSIFAETSSLKQIPELSARDGIVESLLAKDRPLVQFRAMVQSTDSEIYPVLLPGGALGGWGLAELHNGNELDNRFDENTDRRSEIDNLDDRNTVWAISVPGEAPWVSDYIVEDKRGAPKQSRLVRHTDVSYYNWISDVATLNNTWKTVDPQPQKYPIPKYPHLGVNVKIYGTFREVPKLTEVYTFVGILTHEPITTSHRDPHLEDIDGLTLHVLFIRPHPQTIASFHYPIQIPIRTVETDALNVQTVGGSSYMESIREELIEWLSTEALAGDREAAEWVLLAIISTVQSRTPAILPLSISITSFPPPPVPITGSIGGTVLEPALRHALALVVPALVHIPLSIDFINQTPFTPKSVDEDLHSGLLQLPQGTTVLVSDGAISEGAINEAGVRNLQALKQCVTSQTIGYTFPFSSFTFNTDLNFLVLTQGKSSPFLDTDVQIPLQPTQASPVSPLYKSSAEIRAPSAEKLSLFRQLIGGAKLGSITVGPDVSEYIQNDFVHERRLSKDISADDLVLRMAASRTMTLSLHESSLTKDIWERTKSLDNRRRSRTV